MDVVYRWGMWSTTSLTATPESRRGVSSLFHDDVVDNAHFAVRSIMTSGTLLCSVEVLSHTASPCHVVPTLRARHHGGAGADAREEDGRPVLGKPRFQFLEMGCFVQYTCKESAFWTLSLTADPNVRMHVAATAFQFGKSCYERLKTFCVVDDVVHIFRPDGNEKRMHSSVDRLLIPPVTEDRFLQAVQTAVREKCPKSTRKPPFCSAVRHERFVVSQSIALRDRRARGVSSGKPFFLSLVGRARRRLFQGWLGTCH